MDLTKYFTCKRAMLGVKVCLMQSYCQANIDKQVFVFCYGVLVVKDFYNKRLQDAKMWAIIYLFLHSNFIVCGNLLNIIYFILLPKTFDIYIPVTKHFFVLMSTNFLSKQNFFMCKYAQAIIFLFLRKFAK